MNYKLLWDLHTHTTFSHGKGSIRNNAEAASARGLLAVGIADHGPDHFFFGVKEQDFPRMREEVDALREAYPDMRILLGIEANIISRSGKIALPPDTKLDYIIAGYHFGVQEEGRWNLCPYTGRKKRDYYTELYLRALHANKINILSHPGAKHEVDIRAVADACRERGTIMEINGKHGHLTAEELKSVKDTGVKFCIGSDAHKPGGVGLYEEPLRRALEAGVDPEQIVNIAPASRTISKGDLPSWML